MAKKHRSPHSNTKQFLGFVLLSCFLHLGFSLISIYKQAPRYFTMTKQEEGQQRIQVQLQTKQITPKKSLVKKSKKKKVAIAKTKFTPQKQIRRLHKLNYAFANTIEVYVEPSYPRLALRRGIIGAVLLRIDINQDGKVLKIHVAKSSGHEILDNSALKAAKKWRFKSLPNLKMISLNKNIVFKI